MKKVLLISLALILAISMGLIGCTAEEVVEYSLTISSTEGGSVTNPGESGPYIYDEGEIVSLVAEAEEGYEFVSWTGDVDNIADVEDATTTITMNDNYSIIANFSYVEPRMLIELDFASFFSATDFHVTMGFKEWAKSISDRVLAETTNYRVEWNWCPPAGWDALRIGIENGAYDVIVNGPGYYPSVYPLWQGPQYPADIARKNALTMSMAVQALWEDSSSLQNEFAAAEPNVKVMLYWSTGPGYFLMTQGNSVTTLADFAGKTIRVPSYVSALCINALGGTPVSMINMPATLQGFQAGTIQGMLGTTDTPKVYGHVAYVRSCTYAPFSYQFVFFKLMNKDTWNSLPDNVKSIFDEVNAKYTEYYGKLRTWGEADGLQYCYDTIPGFTYYDLPNEDPEEYQNWVDATAHLIDDWIGGNATRQALWDNFVELDEYYATTPPYSTWTPGANPPEPPSF